MSFRIPVTTQRPVETTPSVRKRLRQIRMTLTPPAVVSEYQVSAEYHELLAVHILTNTGAGALGDRHAVFQQLRRGQSFWAIRGSQLPPNYTEGLYLSPTTYHDSDTLVPIGVNQLYTYREFPQIAMSGDTYTLRLNNGQAGDTVVADIYVQEPEINV